LFFSNVHAQVRQYGDTAVSNAGITHLEAPTGSIFLVGHEEKNELGGLDVVVYKLNKDLQPIDTFVLGSAENDAVTEAIWVNNEIAVSGIQIDSAGTLEGFYLRFDTLGTQLAFETFGLPGRNTGFNALSFNGTNQLVLAGFASKTSSPGNGYHAVSINIQGIGGWEYTGEIGNSATANTVCYDARNNRYVMAIDQTNPLGSVDIAVAVLDDAGQLIHETINKDNLNGGCQKVKPISRNRFLVLGESYTPTEPAFDVVAAILDSNYNFTSYELIDGTPLGEAGFNGLELDNGHFLISGYAGDSASGKTGALLLELDASFNEVKKHVYLTSGSVSIGYEIGISTSGELLISGTANGSEEGYFIVRDSLNLNEMPLSSSLSKEINEIYFYPNPVKDGFYISYPYPERGSVTITSTAGQVVVNDYITNNTFISLVDYPAGTYFVRIINSQTHATAKIIRL
jgi:hypothetical protein